MVLFLLRIKEGEREQNETVVEERFFLRSSISAVQAFSYREYVETLTQLRSDVERQVLRDL